MKLENKIIVPIRSIKVAVTNIQKKITLKFKLRFNWIITLKTTQIAIRK